jgi:hypothetical protein
VILSEAKDPISLRAGAGSARPSHRSGVHRSSVEGGGPFAIPDLRDEKTRKRRENDNWSARL